MITVSVSSKVLLLFYLAVWLASGQVNMQLQDRLGFAVINDQAEPTFFLSFSPKCLLG